MDSLSDQINSIIGNDQPDIVCLMAGTNIVGNGEKPFHNGHMKIPREPLTLPPVIQQINVVTGLKAYDDLCISTLGGRNSM